MKTTPFLVGLLLLAGCQGAPTVDASDPHIDTRDELTEAIEPTDGTKTNLPPISSFAGRDYSDALQKELDARNAKREVHTEVMKLIDAGRGEDSGFIGFRDNKGNTRTFDSWPYDEKLSFDQTENGDELSDSEKGKRYEVTYSTKAYWMDAAGEVVEGEVVRKMTLVK